MLLHYKNITLDKVLEDNEQPRKTKIVCTIGPSSSSVDTLVSLIDAGMNICRLNFSHGDHESHQQTIDNIQKAREARPDKHVAILLDTKGPEIRTGFLKHSKAELVKDSEVEIVCGDYEYKGDANCFACSYNKLCESVKPGDRILAADGALAMEVLKVRTEEKSVVVKMLNSGTLGERKNMNLPGNKVDIPTITEKDANDLKAFATQIDFVAVSFVQSGTDAQLVKSALNSGMPDGEETRVKLIAKIENQEGLHNFDGILEEFDSIMVARGDLGMEIPMEKVFLAQKMLIRKSNIAGKPVVTATQMLESMTKNPLPTRAESTDVANAVLDGTDCVMLSGETASGDHPLASVKTLAAICREAESVLNHEKLYLAMVNSSKHENNSRVARESTLRQLEMICSSAVKSSIDNESDVVVVLSENPSAARLVAKYRPKCRVLAVCRDDKVARQITGLNWACEVKLMEKGEEGDVMDDVINWIKGKGWVREQGTAVVLKRVEKYGKFKHVMEIVDM
eukprot:snap_masked-scaffold_2-processed-gene-27.44-mRNA-1 protein AED:0.02 eAED:0.02 QI:0/-1/0/1/-1/1/1/0/509